MATPKAPHGARAIETHEFQQFTNGRKVLYFNDGKALYEAEIDFACGAGHVHIKTFPMGTFANRQKGVKFASEHLVQSENEYILTPAETKSCLFVKEN